MLSLIFLPLPPSGVTGMPRHSCLLNVALLAPDTLFLTYTHPGVETDLLFLPLRFPELENPAFSKALRTAAFAYPFLFDNLPLFCRVRAPFPGSPQTLFCLPPRRRRRGPGTLSSALCQPSRRRALGTAPKHPFPRVILLPKPLPQPLFSSQLRLCWGRAHSCGRDALSSSHGYHLLCALLAGFLFAARLPERLAPGRFDYIGEPWPGREGRLLPGMQSELGTWGILGYPGQRVDDKAKEMSQPLPGLSNDRI